MENMIFRSTTRQDIDMRVLPIVESTEQVGTVCVKSPDHLKHESHFSDHVNPYENPLSESMDDNDDEGDGLIIDDGEIDDELKNKCNDEENAHNSDIDSEGRMLPPKITTDAIETFGLFNSIKNEQNVDYTGLLKATHPYDDLNSEENDEKKDSDDFRDPRLRPSNLFSSLSSLISRYKHDDEKVKSCQNISYVFGKKSPLHTQSIYERKSIYDYASSNSNEDKSHDLFKIGADKDMRDIQFGLDTDLRLPFQPFMDYKPATEIDGALNGFNQIEYKVIK